MKKYSILSILIAILIITFSSSCSILPGNTSKQLNDTQWRLVSYGGKSPIAGKHMTAKFNSGEISGSASCNHYFGAYEISGDRIKIEGLGWTEMACMDPEGIMEQEQVLMNFLSSATEFKFDDNQLQISTTTGDILIFERLID